MDRLPPTSPSPHPPPAHPSTSATYSLVTHPRFLGFKTAPVPSVVPEDMMRVMESRMGIPDPLIPCKVEENENMSRSSAVSGPDGDLHATTPKQMTKGTKRRDFTSADEKETDSLSGVRTMNEHGEMHPVHKKRRPFTKEEDEKINEGVRLCGDKNWDEITKRMGLDRTGEQVQSRYRRMEKADRKRAEKLEMDRRERDVTSGVSELYHPTGASSSPNKAATHLPATYGTIPLPAAMSSTTETWERQRPLVRDEEDLRGPYERLREWEDRLLERERRIKAHEESIATSTCPQCVRAGEQETKARAVLEQMLKEEAERERVQARKNLLENNLRLGRISYQRTSVTGFHEVWEDGEAFKELAVRQNAIMKERDEVDRARKALQKQVRSMNVARTPDEDVWLAASPYGREATTEELAEQDEIYKLQQQRLKLEESDLFKRKEQLELEKNLHIRELKRTRDEDRSMFRDHRLLNDRYFLLNLLGKGGFSEVYKAFDLREYREVACKIHQLNVQWTDEKKHNYIKHATREYNIHKGLVHPRVVRLFDVFEVDVNTFCTVLEYCDGKDLDFVLKTNKYLPERNARSIMMQMVSALKYFGDQKQKIIHYDLKPGNVLFNKGEVKVTDFGLSKIMEEEGASSMELTSQGAGTYWYLPPECFEMPAPKITPKVDVWSVGVIFYQMLFGRRPFGEGMSQERVLHDRVILKACSVDFPAKPRQPVSEDAKNFLRFCLVADEQKRPSVQEIYDHAYFRTNKK